MFLSNQCVFAFVQKKIPIYISINTLCNTFYILKLKWDIVSIKKKKGRRWNKSFYQNRQIWEKFKAKFRHISIYYYYYCNNNNIICSKFSHQETVIYTGNEIKQISLIFQHAYCYSSCFPYCWYFDDFSFYFQFIQYFWRRFENILSSLITTSTFMLHNFFSSLVRSTPRNI